MNFFLIKHFKKSTAGFLCHTCRCYLCEPIADTTSLSLWLASVGSNDCSLAKLLRERGGRTGGEEEEEAGWLILERLYEGGGLVAKDVAFPLESRVTAVSM